MEIKWVQLPVASIKKWFLFLAVPLVFIVVVVLWSAPSGEEEAKVALSKASKVCQQARADYLNTRNPEEEEALKQAEFHLNRATNFVTENEYEQALLAAEESIEYSNKILKQPKAKMVEKPGSIRFDELIGKVLVKPSGSQEYILATKSMLLSEGDRIQTGQKASCRLVFQDGMVTVIRPNSLITIRESVKGRVDPDSLAEIRLETGKLTLKSAYKQSNKAKVDTKAGEASAYDQSELFVSYSALEVATDLSVYEGKAIAKAGETSTEVRINQMVTLRDNQSLSELVDLPAPPRLLTPDNFSKFEMEVDQKLPILLGWESSEATASYHIELSPNILFTEYIHEDNRYFRNTIQFNNLSEGVYFWRVSCINSKHVEGTPSSVFQFQIGQEFISNMVAVDTKPPLLKITDASVYGYTVLVSGRTEKSATVSVNGKKTVHDVATGKFNVALNMPSAGVHQLLIVAKDPAGNKTKIEKTVLIDE